MIGLIALRRLWGSPRARSLAGLACLGLMLIAANTLAARYLTQQFDLTEDRLYTLSDATRRTLAGIDEPITLRLYYSTALGDKFPAYRLYARQVRDLLDRYVAAAPGKLRLEAEDPLPLSRAADRAVAFGLRGVTLNPEGEPGFFGLAGSNSTDDRQTIAFFDPAREPRLEYDLTRLLHALVLADHGDGDGDLAGLRRRGTARRPLEVIERMRREANDRHAVEELALEQRLAAAEERLGALAGGEAANAPGVTLPQQQATVEQLRGDILATRRQLRDVQSARRHDVERLEAILEFCDIALAPILVGAGAIVLTARRAGTGVRRREGRVDA